MVNKWRSCAFVAVLIPISSFDNLMGIMEPLPPVGPPMHPQQRRFQPSGRPYLTWKGYISSLGWLSSCRNGVVPLGRIGYDRSEEHTSELQSHSDLVCRLLLE